MICIRRLIAATLVTIVTAVTPAIAGTAEPLNLTSPFVAQVQKHSRHHHRRHHRRHHRHHRRHNLCRSHTRKCRLVNRRWWRQHHTAVVDTNSGGETVGASEYGGEGRGSCGPLSGYAFAELGMGRFLGGLPCGAKLWITYQGRTIEGEKRDIGEGGDPVEGHTRAIDLYETTAHALGFNGLGLVTIRPAG